MKILFVSKYAYLPELLGGVERSTDMLATAMQRQGATVRVHAAVSYRTPGRYRWIPEAIWRRLMGEARTPPVLGYHGYGVARSLHPHLTLADHVRRFKPDHVILTGGDRAAFLPVLDGMNTKITAYVRDLGLLQTKEQIDAFKSASLISNSSYTANHLKEIGGRDSMILPPTLDWRDYAVDDCKPEAVLFINPKPEKGLEIVLRAAAALPDIPFLMVEGWTLPPKEREALHARLTKLPNVTLLPNQSDMRDVYRRAKILLAPSGTDPNYLFVETWGRVATEAQASGIPVIATDRGGLPDSVGPGGILIAPDATQEVWNDTIQKVWTNAALMTELSDKAIKHARGDLLDPDHHATLLLSFLKEQT